MGCGDSKLAVATSNDILRKKSNAGDSKKKIKDTGTSPKPVKDCDNVTISKGQHQDVKEAAVVANKDIVGILEAEDDVKDINENTKENEGDKETIDNKEDEAGRLRMSVDSQRDFFSSRKLDDIGIDAIICDGRSGASDYYTPRHGPGNKGNLSFKVEDQDSKVVEKEDKELLPAAAAEEEKILLLAAEETKPAVVETTSPSKENTESVVLMEEKMLDEIAEEIKVTTVEAKASSPAASSLADEVDKKETEVEEKKEQMKELEKEENKEQIKELEKEEKKEQMKELEKEEKKAEVKEVEEENKKAEKLELK